MVVHEPNPVAIVAHAIVRPSTPLIFWVHAEVVRPAWRYRAFYRPFLRRLLRLADAIVVASPPIAEHATELQDFRAKCRVIPYAIDPDQHVVTNESRHRIAEIRNENEAPLALFVGRMVPYKGVDVLLHALVGSKARAILVGEGPKRAEWEELAGRLGLGERVRFAGEATPAELSALYQACDMLVLPSVTKAEAFGMVQLEAMACRKPVISTRLAGSGVAWVNRDGETGIVVPPEDPDALRNAIDRLADAPEERVRMGNQGRARVLADFTIARMVEQTTALYRSVADLPIRETEDSVAESVRVS
jgi:rhamnosyl/mannosyltransferase